MKNAVSANTYQFSAPYLRWSGYAVWAILAIFAVIFYEERATFADGGFQLVELINTGDFGIYHYRLSNPVTQIFAWTAVHAGLPLRAVMILYSLNFIVFFALIYHLLVAWCRNEYLAWTQIGFFTLLTTESFYFLTPEFYQGMSLLLLLFGLLLRYELRLRGWLLSGVLILLTFVIFDHLLLTGFFLFLWLYFWLLRPDFRRCGAYYILLAGGGILFYLSNRVFVSWYDAMKSKNFYANLETYGDRILTLPAHGIFAEKCLNLYYFFPLLLLLLTGLYLRRFWKRKNISGLLKLILIWGFCCCYLIINHISDPNTEFLFYSEVNYIGLTVPLCLPLLFDFAGKVRNQRLVLFIAAGIMLLRLWTIGVSHQRFEHTNRWIEAQFADTDTNKIILRAEDAPQKIYVQDWAIPYQTLLLTAQDSPQSAKTLLIATKEEQYLEFMQRNDLHLEVMRQTPLEDLNQHYFELGEGRYLLIQTNPDDR